MSLNQTISPDGLYHGRTKGLRGLDIRHPSSACVSYSCVSADLAFVDMDGIRSSTSRIIKCKFLSVFPTGAWAMYAANGVILRDAKSMND